MQKKHIDKDSIQEPEPQPIQPFNYFATYDVRGLHRQGANSSPDLKQLVVSKMRPITNLSKSKKAQLSTNSANQQINDKNQITIIDSEEKANHVSRKTLYNIVREKRGGLSERIGL